MKQLSLYFTMVVLMLMTKVTMGFSQLYSNTACSCRQENLDLTLSAFYLKPLINEQDYSYIVPSDQSFLNSYYHYVNPDYQWAYRISLDYLYGDCRLSDVELYYTRYNKNDQNNTNQPDGGLLFSSLSSFIEPVISISDSLTVSFAGTPLPNAIATGSFTVPDTQLRAIEAKSEFDLYSINLVFGQKVFNYSRFQLRIQTGLQWTHLSNRLTSTATGGSNEDVNFSLTGSVIDPNGVQTFVETGLLTFVDSDFVQIIEQKSDYQGAGPCAGILAHYRIAGFSLVTNLTSSLLIGKIKSSFSNNFNSTFVGVVSGIPTVVTTDPDLLLTPSLVEGDRISSGTSSFSNFKLPFSTRIVPNLNLEIGLNYCSPVPCTVHSFSFEVGYQLEQYWNSVDLFSAIQSQSPEFHTGRSTNSSLHGPYVKLKFMF